MNKRGVVEVMVVVWVAVAFIIGIFAYKPAVNLLGGAANKKTSQSVIKQEEKLPSVWYIDEKGNKYIAYAYKSVSSNINISETPKQTLWQKVINLGFWGIFLIVLGCLFPPIGAVLMFVWNKIVGSMKREHAVLCAEAKTIVSSIDEGLAVLDMAIAASKDKPEIYVLMVQLKKDFLTALSRKQDATTKLLVAQLQND